ncbi:MAG: hypothetical protein JWL88_774 [Parcubacteria group bacterium]|nr:hypothetical protein [Parcubacteria group bacterium]
MLVYLGKSAARRFCIYAFSDINSGGLNGSTGQYHRPDARSSSRFYYRSSDYRPDELQACGAWHEGS